MLKSADASSRVGKKRGIVDSVLVKEDKPTEMDRNLPTKSDFVL